VASSPHTLHRHMRPARICFDSCANPRSSGAPLGQNKWGKRPVSLPVRYKVLILTCTGRVQSRTAGTADCLATLAAGIASARKSASSGRSAGTDKPCSRNRHVEGDSAGEPEHFGRFASPGGTPRGERSHSRNPASRYDANHVDLSQSQSCSLALATNASVTPNRLG